MILRLAEVPAWAVTGETPVTDYVHYPRPEEYLVSPDTSGQV